MSGSVRTFAVGWLLAASLTGCAFHGHAPALRRVAPPADRSLEAALSPIEPTGLEFDVSQVGTPAAVDRALRHPDDDQRRYYRLTPSDCQCRAAATSAQGNSLASERQAVLASASSKGPSEEARLRMRVLKASELEARNRSAATALDLYYHLAEVEAGLDLIGRSLQIVDGALQAVERMRNEGMEIPFDAGELDRERLDLANKRADLELKRADINGHLMQLIGLSTDDRQAALWPDADWTVTVAAIDREQAVRQGLAQRPEIRLLESLPRSLNAKTLGVTRQVLAGANGLLGTQTKFTSLFPALLGLRDFFGSNQSAERELPARRRQLADYTAQRRAEIADDIRQAALTAEARLRQIALAKQTTESWRRRVAELEEKQQLGQATFVEITSARLKTLQAESDEVSRVVDWKIAQARLEETQGLLIAECPQAAAAAGCP